MFRGLRAPFSWLDNPPSAAYHKCMKELTTQQVMEVITRKQALEQGLTRYFTGKPCKSGHLCERLVNGGCAECRAAIKRRNYRKNQAVPSDQLLKTCCVCGVQFQGRTRNQK